ncbi:zinc finger protein 862-like [Stylophora pistillata]|uniref:zinc finger protein 862-like n=1 Tax=Stylophora pistillata TaxID=50429 RepID=UPI000C04873B|nr:zinc finger protein 862-like [Stylophora pistillata]XP_022809936.1 zinc finger protein 862-like [Stylophora pistillata]
MAARRCFSLLGYFRGTEQNTKQSTSKDKEASTTTDCEDSEPKAKKAKKERAFKEAWRKEFAWLMYDDESGKMFCQYCLHFPNSKNKQSSFCCGSQNFQLDGLRSHERSAGHVLSVDAKVAKTKGARKGTIDAELLRLEKDTVAKMEKLFNTAYYVCYLKMPFSSFPHLCSLQTKNGLVLGQTYRNDHGCKEFCKHISQVMKEEQAAIIKNARFLSVLADGSTDFSVTEEEIVYVRCALPSAETITFYVGLKEVPSAKAPGILHAIETVMDEKDEHWKEKLISTGTDGASVMIGRLGGVVAMLQAQVPHVIGIHCVAHKLELAFADTVKSCEVMKQVKEVLTGCWKHYRYSAKAVRELKELADAMEVNVGKPTKADGTRWVPHFLRAIEVLVGKNYKVIVAHFAHTAEANDSSAEMQGRAKNVYKKLTSYRFLQYLHLLWDIAFEISKVSLVFQRNEVAVSDVKHELDRVDLALHNMARRGGRHLQSFQEKVGDGEVFQDVNLKRAENDTETFARNRENILSDSRRFVQQRFESFCSPVLKAAAVITDHNSWPRTRDQLGMYGEEDVVVLANHYRDVLNRNDFDIDEAKDEWLSLKLHALNTRAMETLTKQVFWNQIYKVNHAQFSHVLMLVEISFTMAVSTSCCERGFSCMSRLKTEYRNSLDVSTVDHLMNICLNGPSPEEFVAEKAIIHWVQESQRARRPNFLD